MRSHRWERGLRAALAAACAALTGACEGEILAPSAIEAPPPPEPTDPDRCASLAPDPGRRPIARLTRDEYVATIRGLFAVDVTASAAALPHEIRAPLSTTAVSQSVDFAHVETFSAVAREVAEALPDLSDRWAPCAELTERCARGFVEALGGHVFRRPLRDEEVAPYLTLFDVVAEEGDGFDVGASLVLRAMLQSPQFLYHLEDRRGGGVRRVDDHDLANRIAYLVWHGPPDAPLRAAAADGALSEPAAIEAEVRRLAADPRAVEASLAFFEDWVDLTRLERAVRDVDDGTKAQMRAETERFVREVLWREGGGLIDLLTTDHTWVTPELAAHYGLERRGDGALRYDLSTVPERRGVLTQASVLAAHANGNRPAVVSRGLFMLRTVLCRDVPDPPANVDTTETSLPETASERERSAERLARESCRGCHRAFDPLAYAFDRFDGTGRLVDRDRHGNPVRGDGWVPAVHVPARDGEAPRDLPYEDVHGLVDRLAALPPVRSCLAQQPLAFALRRALDPYVSRDACLIEQVAAETERLGGSYTDLLVAIATHPAFALVDTSSEEGSP